MANATPDNNPKESDIKIHEKTAPINESKPDSPEKTADDEVTFGGKVENEQGEPIANVKVEICWDIVKIYMDMMDSREVQTDAQGKWNCMVPKDLKRAWIELDHPEYINEEYHNLSLKDLRENNCILMMRRGLTVSGKVCDANGVPIPQALIQSGGADTISGANGLVEDSTMTRTREDGTFTLHGIEPGEQKFTADHNNYAPQIITVNVKQNIEPITFLLETGGILKGRVIDAGGEPIEGVIVKCDQWRFASEAVCNDKNVCESNKLQTILRLITQTNAKGEFQLEHVPTYGQLVLYFKKPDSDYLIGSSLPDLPQKEILNKTLFAPPVISGRVVDDINGNPIQKFEITRGVRWAGESEITWTNHPENMESEKGIFHKKIGHFAVYDEPASVALRITAKGYLPAITPLVKVGENNPFVTIRLKPDSMNLD